MTEEAMRTHTHRSKGTILAGGIALVGGAVAFLGVFSYLAATFNYPDVLDGRAGDVLPALRATGDSGRAAWAFYSILPLIWIPAGVGAFEALRARAGAACCSRWEVAVSELWIRRVLYVAGAWNIVSGSLDTLWFAADTGSRRQAPSAVVLWKEYTVGDKGGKKNKDKNQKQKAAKQKQEAKKKQDKQQKSAP